MSLQDVNAELERLLPHMDAQHQERSIKPLDRIILKYGTVNIEKWHNRANKKNSLLHELVEREMNLVVEHIVKTYQLDVNVRRATDGLTPFALASFRQLSHMCELLQELGADDTQAGNAQRWRTDEEKEQAMNIVWLDLEMTSIEDPHIMECAVIITDANLKEVDAGSWVIHFDQSVLDKLGTWQKKTFADRDDDGNGLFAECVQSKLTKDEVEEELLTLLKRHCPPNTCSLAGSSIHIDKRVLEREMPRVHAYLHYRIIDVSSFQAIMRRWAPWMERKIKAEVSRKGPDNVSHRAMDDIKWSISFMREFRPFLQKEPPRNGNNNGLVVRNQNHGTPFKRSNSEPQGASDMELPKIKHVGDPMELYVDERRLVERIKFERNFDVKALKLLPKWQEFYDSNPHLREVFINRERIQLYENEFTKENRFLISTAHQPAGSIGYDPKKVSTTEHWGQRKLLLPEIEFLTKYGTETNVRVVYAGAAPGTHIRYLALLFPRIEFILFDDKEFSLELRQNISLRSVKFTDQYAADYKRSSKKILFICNVRTHPPQEYGQNTGLNDDMETQMRWHTIMEPHASLLNFRPPRENARTEYFKGHLIIEPWTSRKSMECRLIVKKDARMIDYDYQEFQNSMRYFQSVTRTMYYRHDMDEVTNEGLDHCYDCQSEIFILQEYLAKIQGKKNGRELQRETARMSGEISREIIDSKRKSILDVPRTLDVIPKRSAPRSSNV